MVNRPGSGYKKSCRARVRHDSRPTDACPFERPFPVDFDECPAFEERRFVGLDLRHEPLEPVRTCEHLTVGKVDNRHYGRCTLGSFAERLAWVRQHSA